ncbi:STAS-like domain-containing protein [Pseudomonas luteola]
MDNTIRINPSPVVKMLGMRHSAIEFNQVADRQLQSGNRVIIDFEAVNVTQGFIDALIGQLILKHGVEVIPRFTFINCNEDVKQIIRFVIADRKKQMLNFAASQSE